jgi:hypothetical protein
MRCQKSSGGQASTPIMCRLSRAPTGPSRTVSLIGTPFQSVTLSLLLQVAQVCQVRLVRTRQMSPKVTYNLYRLHLYIAIQLSVARSSSQRLSEGRVACPFLLDRK